MLEGLIIDFKTELDENISMSLKENNKKLDKVSLLSLIHI